MTARPRPITGLNLHPVVKWDDARRFAANAASACDGIHNKTGDDRALQAQTLLTQALRLLGECQREYQDHLDSLALIDPGLLARCRDGEIPWPDVERVEGFVPRCTCHDRCLHERGLEPGPNGVCNCGRVCPQHEESADAS